MTDPYEDLPLEDLIEDPEPPEEIPVEELDRDILIGINTGLEELTAAVKALAQAIQAQAIPAVQVAQVPAQAQAPAQAGAVPAWNLPPAPAAANSWTCPDHNSARVVPAGVSKATGRPYAAFLVCGVQGCQQRPPR